MSDMLELPEWYEGGFVDAEELVMSYFRRLLGDRVFLCTWLPQGHYVLSPGEKVGGTQPTLRIWRQPGRFDPTLRRDEALVQIAAITPTRYESWRLIDFVRCMLDHDVCVGFPVTLPDGETTSMHSSEEWQGPQLVPERLVDEKFIPVTFKIGIREPFDLPNYRKILNALP
ncbi:tail terminator [Mycobacterium phage Reindeer]|uniref:Tail terminator n=1 Tax=Mycobacterium phage Reindeer TaxID=2762283 RepID=A0A7G8LHV8_9CAUD|nr:tail terminator [Mycobacterium phage Reindeer]QNJ56830.1 tail terminator [Mycobacterium phage Reindeer]